MSYFVLMGRRIPKQAITGFRFQNETDNIRPFLSIRIRGKEEIIPFKDKREILSVKAHLCSVFSKFVKIGDWYLKMSEVKEYKPVTAEDMNRKNEDERKELKELCDWYFKDTPVLTMSFSLTEEDLRVTMERDVELSAVAGAVKNQHHKKKI